MWLEAYIVVELLAFLFFFLSFKWLDQRLLFTAVSLVLFAMLGISAGNIEHPFATTTIVTNDMGLMIMNFLFGTLSLLYLLAYVFGYATEAADGAAGDKL